MADPVTITVSGATLALVAERLFAYFVSPKLRTKEETDARKPPNSSGDKDPAFWQQEFRAAIDEKLEQRVIPILEKQTSILESLAHTSEGIADSVSRRRRR